MSSQELTKAREFEARRDTEIAPGERPVFHVTPTSGWLNDPNGFSFYQGAIHLFYQYYPYKTIWGPMHWGHVRSRDFIRWERLPAAMAPDEVYDADGVFSGSADVLPDGRQILMYTAVQPDENGTDKPWVQQQCLAFGDGLDYVKYDGNPVLTFEDLPFEIRRTDFRDPKIWRDEEAKCWRAVIAVCLPDETGAICLFESADALHWQYAATLDESGGEFGQMWECPDFYELDGKAVLVVSPMKLRAKSPQFNNGNTTIALIGSFDHRTRAFTREAVQALDSGLDFYAPQTLAAPDGRRIMIAWMQSWESSKFVPDGAQWYGMLTLPREIRIRNGRLLQQPVRELEQYRRGLVRFADVPVKGQCELPGMRGRVLDLGLAVRPASWNGGHSSGDGADSERNGSDALRRFRIRFAEGDGFCTALTWDVEDGTLTLDRSLSGFPYNIAMVRTVPLSVRSDVLRLRVILDRFSAEIFVGDGEQVLSACIYTPQSADGISFEAAGAALLTVEKYDIDVE